MEGIITSQVIEAVIVAIGIVITSVLVYVVKKVSDWFRAKIGDINFNRALKVAVGIWKQLEEEYKDIPKSGEQKKAKMEEMLLKIFPNLTQEELDSINKQVHMAITNSIEGITEAIGVKDIIS